MGAANDTSLADQRVGAERPFILATKLYTPKPQATFVARPHLIKKLNTGLHCQLTLLSAPAGFGKTSLVTAWAKEFQVENASFAWISLDQNDNDPVRFLTYFIAGLQKIEVGLGEAALDWLQSSTESPIEAIVAGIINDIVEQPHDLTLIFDDFHLITEPAIHEAFAFLLDNQPPNLHLIIISRADPPWPLARLRARRALNEIRAKDLRFSVAETAVFLNNIMGLNLSPDDVATLDKQTEGWITGLQMAALSMQSRGNKTAFIQTFSASHTFILDYLVEEVLEQQPLHIQTFLLQTAILERMTAPLCDAVTKNHDSQTILNQLEQSNLFLVPLDDERGWYRYHHLFADLLRSGLENSRPDLLPELHRRASEWHAQAEMADEAIAHALAGNNTEWAASYIEQAAFEAIRRNREVTLSSWLKALPLEELRKRPWLCVAQAYIHQWLGFREQVEEWLQCAEQKVKDDPTLVEPSSEAERLAGYIASMRGHIALISGDVQAVVVQANKVLDSLPDEDSWRMASQVALGGAHWAMGDINAAEKKFARASSDGKKFGDRMVQVTAGCYAGMQQVKQGQLRTALKAFQFLKAVAVRSNGRLMPVAGMPGIKIGDLLREWNELVQAKAVMDEGVELCVQMSQSDVLAEAYISQARLCLALSDINGTLNAIQKAEAVMTATPVDMWLTCWLDECRLRYWLSMGDVDTAVHWANTSGLTVDGDLSYHHDLHHLNLARVLIAQGVQEPERPYLDAAQSLLTRLLDAAEQAGWVHETIKILILQAIVWESSGEIAKATAVLSQALTLAEPGGYVRLFIDEGEPMRRLLQQMGGESAYARQLLAPMGGKPSPSGSPLIDPLSQRELDVLRLLNTHLSSTEIAEELFIAPSTVRSHIKNIYSKLNVHSRTEAVVRAEELHLL